MKQALLRLCRGPWQAYRKPVLWQYLYTRTMHTTRWSHQRYELVLRTGDARGAGCSTAVDVVLRGSLSEIKACLTPPFGRFERGSEARFCLDTEGTALGVVSEVYVGITGEPKKDGWLLDSVDVQTGAAGDRQGQPPELYHFDCNQWLGGRESLQESVCLRPSQLSAPLTEALTLRQRLSSTLRLRHSAAALPHPSKIKAGGPKARVGKQAGFAGEDAYAVVAAAPDLTFLAVADGVQEWQRHGIDSGALSQGLVTHMAQGFGAGASKGAGDGTAGPQALILAAYTQLMASGVQGSTTVCAAVMDGATGTLSTANIGDSRLLVLRNLDPDSGSADGSTPAVPAAHSLPRPCSVLHTRVQEHRFGHPFQLGHHPTSDRPEDAELSATQLQAGDILVLGTDGLWDNLTARAVAQLLQSCSRKERWASASRLAHAAFAVSIDRHSDSPWALEATEELGMFYSGGKQDDITVLVAEVIAG